MDVYQGAVALCDDHEPTPPKRMECRPEYNRKASERRERERESKKQHVHVNQLGFGGLGVRGNGATA